uniref:Uncharacterized protein n=1 Tax=Cyanoderma ruficeps TaxID=181631 RepID=A0A8C3RI31_9PASS
LFHRCWESSRSLGSLIDPAPSALLWITHGSGERAKGATQHRAFTSGEHPGGSGGDRGLPPPKKNTPPASSPCSLTHLPGRDFISSSPVSIALFPSILPAVHLFITLVGIFWSL